MNQKVRILIFAIVLLAVGAIFAYPYLNTNIAKQSKNVEKFTITKNPASQVNAAIKRGKPVYLEFYGGT